MSILGLDFGRPADFPDAAPLPALPRGFSERLSLEFDSFRATERSISEELGLYVAYEDAAEAIYKATNERPANPMTSPPAAATVPEADEVPGLTPPTMGATRERTAEEWDKAVKRLKEQHPDASIDLWDTERVRKEADRRALEATRRAQRGALVPTFSGEVGAFLGAVGGTLTDPLVLASLPIGAGRTAATTVAGRILRAAAIEGAVGAGAQIGVEAYAQPFRERLGLENNAGFNILAAGAGGAIFGGGLRGLAEAFRAIRGISPELPPRAQQDAMAAVERELSTPAPRAEADQVNLDLADRAVRRGETAPVRPVETGETARVFTAAGRGIDVRYEVVELSDLVPSQTDDLTVNAAYPAELQPRDRTRAASEAQVTNIAGNLEPARLGRSAEASSGAPIIGPDNVVESGNGRTLALRRVYREGRGEPYRKFLEDEGYDTSRFREPVLVARRVTPLAPDERAAVALEANQSATLTMGAAETALSDSRRLDRILSLQRPGEVTLAGNRDFVRAFLAGLPEGERGAMMTKDGELSQAGRRRIEAALLARAYGDEAPELVARLNEATDSDVKAIAGALLDNAGSWARMRAAVANGEIAPGMDTTADLAAAVKILERARQQKQKVADLAANGEMFGGGLTDTGRAWLGLFFTDGTLARAASRVKVSERIGQYVEEAMKSTPGRDMFGAPELGGLDLLRGESRAALGDLARADAQRLRQPGRPVDDAAVLDAQRIVAASDPDVPSAVLDEEGNVVSHELRKASDAMAADDEAEAAAREAGGCLIGAVTGETV